FVNAMTSLSTVPLQISFDICEFVPVGKLYSRQMSDAIYHLVFIEFTFFGFSIEMEWVFVVHYETEFSKEFE
ncbi:unnamed protein product, partial [Heterotrigona itama]